MKDWITFHHTGASPSGKTQRWNVMANDDDALLGTVSYYAPWRKYLFQPKATTSYDADSLRRIANFCEIETQRQREVRHGQ